MTNFHWIFTDRIRRMGRANVFSLCVSSHLGSHQLGGVPPFPGLDGGLPLPRSGQGVSHPADRGTPFPGLDKGGTPFPGSGYPPAGVPPTRPAQCVLAMRRSVCLLRSHRRTFLFMKYFAFQVFEYSISVVFFVNIIFACKPNV